MAWVIPLLVYPLWALPHAVFFLLRVVSWFIRVIFGSSVPKENTVQVYSIWGRHKFDVGQQPSGKDNFLLLHHSWTNPESVLDDSITLFYVIKNEAVFVQCRPDIDATSPKVNSFITMAQYYNAQRLLVMPIADFHKLASRLGDPRGQLVFIANTARCGSTLLAQIFDESGRCLAFSEPDCMNCLSVLDGNVPLNDYERIARSTVRLLCKPNNRVPECLCYAIKLTSPITSYLPYLVRLFPNAVKLFMYRDGLPMCKSFDRAAHSLPLIDMVFYVGRYSEWVTKSMVRIMGLPTDVVVGKASSRIYGGAMMWAGIIDMYRKFREQGMNVAGVKIGHIKPEEYTARIRAICDTISERFRLPRLDEPCILEGTITHKENDVNVAAPLGDTHETHQISSNNSTVVRQRIPRDQY